MHERREFGKFLHFFTFEPVKVFGNYVISNVRNSQAGVSLRLCSRGLFEGIFYILDVF
jgi:hypothetical protein